MDNIEYVIKFSSKMFEPQTCAQRPTFSVSKNELRFCTLDYFTASHVLFFSQKVIGSKFLCKHCYFVP